MNKKGFTIYELVISFALAFAILLVIFNTSISLNKKLSQLYVKNKLSSKQIILNKKLGNDFTNKTISNILKENNKCTITYSDGSEIVVIANNADGNKHVLVGDEKIVFDEEVDINTDITCDYIELEDTYFDAPKYYQLKIPITYSSEKTDYGIDLFNFNT